MMTTFTTGEKYIYIPYLTKEARKQVNIYNVIHLKKLNKDTVQLLIIQMVVVGNSGSIAPEHVVFMYRSPFHTT